MTKAEPTVIGLAILKVNSDRADQDYIDYIAPFVADVLTNSSESVASAPEIQSQIEAEFGIRVPLGALNTVLRRASRRGLVTLNRGVYTRNEAELAKFDMRNVRNDILRKYAAFVTGLRKFALDEFSIPWQDEDAEKALIAFLTNDSLPTLAAAIDGSPLPPLVGPAPEGSQHIVRCFALKCNDSDPIQFDFLVSIVKGSMLATALYYPKLGEVSKKLDRIEVYLDTSVVLRAIGATRAAQCEVSRELIDLTFKLGGTPCCFRQTMEEVRGVLEASYQLLRRGTRNMRFYGETIQHFLDCKPGSTDGAR